MERSRGLTLVGVHDQTGPLGPARLMVRKGERKGGGVVVDCQSNLDLLGHFDSLEPAFFLKKKNK